MQPDKQEERLIEGVLIPVAWGRSGEVTEIGLMTFDESEYRIDPSMGRVIDLSRYLRKPVRVSVCVRGQRMIQIVRIELLVSPVNPE